MKFGSEKTFLLGVGCPKGGTSWLHDYLCSQSCSDFGFAKEYHVFDALYLPECRHFQDEIVSTVTALADNDALLTRNHPNLFKRLDFLRDTDNYFEYFAGLARKSNSTLLVGDITPSYCALPIEAFQLIREKLLSIGFRPRVIFVMRDPFERIWSALRMKRARDPEYARGISEAEGLQAYYTYSKVEIRTRYEVTISNLKSVFEPEELFFQLYEDLFKDDSIRAIDEFIGIPYSRPNLDKVVNESKKQTGIEPSLQSSIVEYYSETYKEVEVLFGQDRLTELWPSYPTYRRACVTSPR